MELDMSKHVAIIGQTQSGKTVLANYLFQRTGGLYIDLEDVGDVRASTRLSRRYHPTIFKRALQRHKKVRYVPSWDEKIARKEVMWIWRQLRELRRTIYVYADEIQHYGSPLKNAFDVYAIRGLKYGIHLVSISQRPAYISKTIMTQTTTFIFFNIGEFERTYFYNYQLPYDEILERFKYGKEYSFVVYQRGKGLKGPYRLIL